MPQVVGEQSKLDAAEQKESIAKMQVKETEIEKKKIDDAEVKKTREQEAKKAREKREKDGPVTANKASEMTKCDVSNYFLFIFT